MTQLPDVSKKKNKQGIIPGQPGHMPSASGLRPTLPTTNGTQHVQVTLHHCGCISQPQPEGHTRASLHSASKSASLISPKFWDNTLLIYSSQQWRMGIQGVLRITDQHSSKVTIQKRKASPPPLSQTVQIAARATRPRTQIRIQSVCLT